MTVGGLMGDARGHDDGSDPDHHRPREPDTDPGAEPAADSGAAPDVDSAVDPEAALDAGNPFDTNDPVPANRSLRGLVARLGTECSALGERTSALADLLGELQGALRSESTAQHDVVAVERLAAGEVRAALPELIREAHQGIRVMNPTLVSGDPPWLDGTYDGVFAERALPIRSIYPHTARRQREALKYLRLLTTIGARLRTATSVPGPIVLIDDHVAVLLEFCGGAGVLVREPRVLAFLSRLFEETWSRALPVTEYDYDQNVWREIEILVLMELAAGRSDEAIARRLDISTRTLRRYITGLYERLGVESRFQLGVAAARSGILSADPEPDPEAAR